MEESSARNGAFSMRCERTCSSTGNKQNVLEVTRIKNGA
jgi:hypothetical protein